MKGGKRAEGRGEGLNLSRRRRGRKSIIFTAYIWLVLLSLHLYTTEKPPRPISSNNSYLLSKPSSAELSTVMIGSCVGDTIDMPVPVLVKGGCVNPMVVGSGVRVGEPPSSMARRLTESRMSAMEVLTSRFWPKAMPVLPVVLTTSASSLEPLSGPTPWSPSTSVNALSVKTW